jgi:peroxiredoxin Q/BCP
MLEVGDRFPVEKLPVQLDGAAVVYFYAAAGTPGCSLEAKEFNDRYQRFRDAGYEVVGISIDTSDANSEFKNECGLDFPIVSDEGAVLTKELDLMKQYGEHGIFARRMTYLLDADGVVQRVWEVGEIGGHPEEVLAAVEQ